MHPGRLCSPRSPALPGARNRPHRHPKAAPALQSLKCTAPADHRGHRRLGEVDRRHPLRQGDGVAHALVGVFVKLRERAQVQIVGIETFGRLVGRPVDLGLMKLGLDCPDDATGDLILQFENVVQRTVEPVCPDMSAGRRVDQLPCDALPLSGLTLPFEHVAHSQLTRTCFTSTGRPLYVKLELLAITNSHDSREIAAAISSTMPSAKYSRSGSPLILAKGSTAIDGLSGRGSTGCGGGAGCGGVGAGRAASPPHTRCYSIAGCVEFDVRDGTIRWFSRVTNFYPNQCNTYIFIEWVPIVGGKKSDIRCICHQKGGAQGAAPSNRQAVLRSCN